jgi:hypothetical protein
LQGVLLWIESKEKDFHFVDRGYPKFYLLKNLVIKCLKDWKSIKTEVSADENVHQDKNIKE